MVPPGQTLAPVIMASNIQQPWCLSPVLVCTRSAPPPLRVSCRDSQGHTGGGVETSLLFVL